LGAFIVHPGEQQICAFSFPSTRIDVVWNIILEELFLSFREEGAKLPSIIFGNYKAAITKSGAIRELLV